MNFIGDFHTHTLASTHAYSTITENAKWSSEHGIKFLATTDHGTDMEDAPHLWHFYNLKVIPDELFGVRIIKGIEANIRDENGTLDIYDPFVYKCVQWVNASMHYPLMMPSDKNAHTKAYLSVLQNPHVDVICHSESEQYDYDFDAVAKECANQGKLIELNVTRLYRGGVAEQRYAMILEACEKYGTSIVVNSDAHFYTAIGDFDVAKDLIAKTGFPEKLVFNADEDRVLTYLKNKHPDKF